ncbi:unnamed protein product [Menidia menidia]|uniref:(Atlantic silverside) hypothetical protein n=1 Tax=Menidia menidia TaxID=238744 RepID=A0A8S4AFX9_9TELE|nr:unnamed protein product [Menidia menidia]
MEEERQQEDRNLTCQHSDNVKEEKTLSSDDSMTKDPADDVKQQLLKDTDVPSIPTTEEVQNSNIEDTTPTVEDDDVAENQKMPQTEGSPPSEQEKTTTVEDIGRADNESHGDYNKELHNERLVVETDAIPDLLKTSAPEEEQTQTNTDSAQTPFLLATSALEETDDGRCHVKTLHPTDAEDSKQAIQDKTGIFRGIGGLLVIVMVLVAILVQYCYIVEPPLQKNDLQQVDIFLKQLEEIKTRFPAQRAELWSRSKIHLKRHLQTIQPTEPVSLILTAGFRADRTLYCLAQSLASAFSSALNASVLQIDGASKSSQDSDQVKLDIDSKLQGAFEGDKPAVVIHRFEELPPASTLIFYRYCDHENAAYKKTLLIFTVLLDEEEEIPAAIHLSALEEMVDDHLQKKFLSHDHPVSFDRMDLDKYSGLWSRISHLILPVAAEERINTKGC